MQIHLFLLSLYKPFAALLLSAWGKKKILAERQDLYYKISGYRPSIFAHVYTHTPAKYCFISPMFSIYNLVSLSVLNLKIFSFVLF